MDVSSKYMILGRMATLNECTLANSHAKTDKNIHYRLKLQTHKAPVHLNPTPTTTHVIC